MSLMMDLPTQSSSKYTEEEIHAFDLHRKEYRESAKFVKDHMYGENVLTVMLPEIRNFKHESHLKYTLMLLHQDWDTCKTSQLLCKYTPGTLVPRAYDAITAIYVPEFVESYTLTYGVDHYCNVSTDYIKKTLEDELRESKRVPSTRFSEENLKNILKISKDPDASYKHDQREIIYIDNLRYIRTLPVQPALYCCDAPSCYPISIKLNDEYNENVVFYLETNCLTAKHRKFGERRIMFFKDSLNKLIIQRGNSLTSVAGQSCIQKKTDIPKGTNIPKSLFCNSYKDTTRIPPQGATLHTNHSFIEL